MLQIVDCEQNSNEWRMARLGIPTASMFATVMRAKGRGEDGSSKTRAEYMRKLAGEILTGQPMESYTNGHIERGHEQEDEARKLYAFLADATPQRVGFVRNEFWGCSPDSLIGDNGGLEIKSALPHIQIDRLLRGGLPPEHKAQVQGNMMVCDRIWWDFVSYCPSLPPLIVRAWRDEDYVSELTKALDQFNSELHAMVEKIRGYDARVAA